MSETVSISALSDDVVQRMRAATESNDWPQAALIAGAVLEKSSDDLQALFFASMADIALNNWDRAADYLARLAALVPDMREVQAQRAHVAQMRGDIPTLIAAIGDIVATTPDDAPANQRLVDISLLFDHPEARHRLANACAHQPDDAYFARIEETLTYAAQVAPATPKLVALVSDTPRVREAKIARAIKMAGWDVALLYQHAPVYDTADYFDQSVQYVDCWDAVAKTKALHPAVCHAVAQMKYETVGALLTAKPCPVVVDTYDNVAMLGDGFLAANPVRLFDRALEDSVFERADGYVCRNLETQVNIQRGNSRLRGKRLFFPEYCWQGIPQKPKLSETDGRLHVVQGGSFWIEKQNPGADGDGGMLWLAELFDRVGVHFHIYPSGPTPETFEEILSDYRDFEARSEFFHLHRPIPDIHAFIAEVSAYDIGVMVHRSPLREGPVWQYADQKYAYCYGNKLADFVDANLHVMTLPGFNLFHYLLRHMAIDIAATPDMFSQEYWDVVRERVLDRDINFDTVQTTFSLKAHAHRLTTFYDRFASDAGTS